jgi:hypothetical protein
MHPPDCFHTVNRLFPTFRYPPRARPPSATFLPRLPGTNAQQTKPEAVMKFANSLLAKFGLFAKKPAVPDAFDLRLKRIGMRESRLQVRLHIFTGQPQPMEA